MVRFVVPRIVGEVTLGDNPQVLVALGSDSVWLRHSKPFLQEGSHGLPNHLDVVRVYVVEERTPHQLPGGVAKYERGMLVHFQHLALFADPHIEAEIDLIGCDRLVDVGQVATCLD